MALYAIGDLHLSLTADKPMEVFGPAWENYTERIGDALSRLTAGPVPLQKVSGEGEPRLLVVHGVQNEELLHGEGPYHPGLSP